MKRVIVVAVAVLLGACLGMAPPIGPRAAYDLQCPEAQLTVRELDTRTRGVEGCGQRATYIFNAQSGVWILNNPPAPITNAMSAGASAAPANPTLSGGTK